MQSQGGIWLSNRPCCSTELVIVALGLRSFGGVFGVGVGGWLLFCWLGWCVVFGSGWWGWGESGAVEFGGGPAGGAGVVEGGAGEFGELVGMGLCLGDGGLGGVVVVQSDAEFFDGREAVGEQGAGGGGGFTFGVFCAHACW